MRKKIVEHGDRQALLTLVTQFKRDVDEPLNGEQETFLHLACKAGHLDVIRTLIEVCGCNVNVMDRQGNTPCLIACANGHLKVMNYFRYCQYHSKFDCSNHAGDTLLHAACQSGSVPLVRWVILTCMSQVHIKLNMYYDEVFSYLQENLGKKETFFFPINKLGYSPVHTACSKNHCKVIKFFFFEFSNYFESDLRDFIPSLKGLAYKLGHTGTLKMLCSNFKCTLDYQVHFARRDSHNGTFSIFKTLSPFITESHCRINKGKGECKPKRSIGILNQLMMKDKSEFFSTSEPLFFYAVRCGDKKYRDWCDDSLLTSCNDNGDTLLHAACVSGDYDIVKDIYALLMGLWNEEDLITEKNKMGNTCLHLACEWGFIDIANFLLEKRFSLKEVNKLNLTPLHIAVVYNRPDIVYHLWSLDVDRCVQTRFGETILHIVSADSDLNEFAQELLSHAEVKSLLNAKDKFGETPIFNAYRLPEVYRKEMVMILKDSDLCFTNDKKETLAYIAGRLKDFALLDSVLSQEKYPIQNQNTLKQTLLQVVLSLHDLSVAKHINNNTNKYVYKIKDDINLVDNFSDQTPLQSAYCQNDIEVFKFLLSIDGCDLDIQNLKDGNALLHFICSDYRKEFAEQCLEKCSLETVNKEGNTPLHIAASKSDIELLGCLLKGVKKDLTSQTNDKGDNLLHIVAALKEGEVVLDSLLARNLVNVLSKNLITGDTAVHIAFNKQLMPNLLCLLKHCPKYSEVDYESLCNIHKFTPFYMRLIDKLDFFSNLVDNFQPVLYYPGAVNVQLGAGSNTPVNMPVFFHFIYLMNQNNSNTECCKYLQFIQRVLSNPSCRDDLLQLRDSHNNTLLHYIALIKASDCYCYGDKNTIFHDIYDLSLKIQDKNINHLNSSNYAPIHLACCTGNDRMIWALLKHPEGSILINEKSERGSPMELYRSHSNSDADSFLVSHGAHPKKQYIKDTQNMHPSLKVFVIGNSGVGKTTLIDAVKRLFLNDQTYTTSDQTSTIGVLSSEMVFQDLVYDFKDFGGHTEFEMVRSISFQSILLSATKSHIPLPLYVLLVLKSTDSLENKKRQIDRWMEFLLRHINENGSFVHVILVCTHADKLGNSSDENEKIFQHFKATVSSPLIYSGLEVLLNGKIRDASPLGKLRQYFERTFFHFKKSFSLSDSAKLMFHYLNKQSFIIKFGTLKENIREYQKFKLSDQGVIQFVHNDRDRNIGIIPQDDDSLSDCITRLHNFGSISLLLNSHDKADCWVVNKQMEVALHSKVMSFLAPGEMQDNNNCLQLKNNVGLVPEAELLQYFIKQNLNIDPKVIIPYLLSNEICTRVQGGQLDIIDDEKCFENDKALFIPSLIKKTKDMKASINPRGPFLVIWSMESKINFDIVFTNSLLLNLAFKFSSKDESHYKRRLFIWKTGLFWSTEDQIEVLVEFCEGNKLSLTIHSTSGQGNNMLYNYTKYRCEVIREIRKIRRKCLLQDDASCDDKEYFHYPAENLMTNDTQFLVQDILNCFKKEFSSRTVYNKDEGRYIHLEKILLFDPFICLQSSHLKNLKNLRIDEFSEDCRNFFKFLRNQGIELSLSSLQEYSIFDVEDITSLTV